MQKIVLIGGGGHCKSVLDTILQLNEYSEIVITDANLPIGTKIYGCPVVGNDTVIPELQEQGFENAFVTAGNVGSPTLRKRLVEKAEQFGLSFPIIIDPTACVSSRATIGAGTFVGKNAVINTAATVGEHCIINTGSIVEHDSSVADFCHIATGAILCGGVNVGKHSFLGAGTTVIQSINIGENVVIGAGSTVVANVKDHTRAYGVVGDKD